MPHQPTVTVQREAESGAGWTFTLRVDPGAPAPTRAVTLRLSWADYDRFGGGRATPADVALAAARAALDLGGPAALAEADDASTLARRWPAFDERLRASLPR